MAKKENEKLSPEPQESPVSTPTPKVKEGSIVFVNYSKADELRRKLKINVVAVTRGADGKKVYGFKSTPELQKEVS